MIKVLKWLWITQEIDNRQLVKRVGKGYNIAYRLNPYNLLSYLFIPIVLVMGFVLFGFVGLKEKLPMGNPFKWH
jgi:hypothetical protein